MRKDKAFTLVELIAVIAIIAIILLFTLPSIISITKKTDNKEYERFLKDIYLATDTYLANSDSSSLTEIVIDDLIKSGYLTSSMINPKTGKQINKQDKVILSLDNNGNVKYTFESVN